jgi:(5-formylfuran-3-yl)methyl phosphate synthase
LRVGYDDLDVAAGNHMAEMTYALSLKQPWATLLVHGLKTIEIRRWSTTRQGRVLIHAARHPDPGEQAWARLPEHLQADAQQRGGIVGAGDLTGCIAYRTARAFAADRGLHLNEPSWFRPPVLFGMTFANLTPLPFRPYPGWMRFFPVTQELPVRKRASVPALQPGLLVSVRSATEAASALAGGADLIDVKEPSRGSLGRADDAVIAAVVQEVAGRRPVSAALGDVCDFAAPYAKPGLSYWKLGLAGCARQPERFWKTIVRSGTSAASKAPAFERMALVAYADWQRADAPPPPMVLALARAQHCGGIVVDTFRKDGSTLLHWLTLPELTQLCAQCRADGMHVALAGSLGAAEIALLAHLRPTWFAVRGAACRKGEREALIDEERVRQLAGMVHEGER